MLECIFVQYLFQVLRTLMHQVRLSHTMPNVQPYHGLTGKVWLLINYLSSAQTDKIQLINMFRPFNYGSYYCDRVAMLCGYL